MDKLDIEAVLEVWKKNIDIQMHFNEIEIKIRNLFISIILAITAASGWIIEKGFSFNFGNLKISFALLLLFAGIVAAYLFLLMDRYWYHQLLKGAVDRNIKLESEYGDKIKAFSVTTGISGASPIIGLGNTFFGRVIKFFHLATFSNSNLHSTGKIELFYMVPIRIFQLSIFLTILLGGVAYKGLSLGELFWSSIMVCS